MRSECVKEKIENAVAIVGKVSGKQMNLPVLSCIKISAEKNAITLSATNLDMAVEYTLPAKVTKEGVIAVPANILSSLLSSLGNEANVTLETFQGNLRIVSSKSSTVIKALPHDDFPVIQHIEGGTPIKISSKDLITGLSSVSTYCSTSAVKAELASVFIYGHDSELYFVATDSFRLGEKRFKMKNVPDIKVLIPSRNVTEIIRAFNGVSETIEMVIGDHQVALRSPGVYITSRTVEGTFPDYKQIIPKEKKTDVILLKEDLLQVLKALSVFSDKFNQLHLTVLPSEKRLEVSTKNSDVGESHHSPKATISGEPLEVNFNIRYLLDCLPIISTDSLSLEFNGSGRPLLMKGIGDTSFLYLVMPMNK